VEIVQDPLNSRSAAVTVDFGGRLVKTAEDDLFRSIAAPAADADAIYRLLDDGPAADSSEEGRRAVEGRCVAMQSARGYRRSSAGRQDDDRIL
jgi:hypothetical protein